MDPPVDDTTVNCYAKLVRLCYQDSRHRSRDWNEVMRSCYTDIVYWNAVAEMGATREHVPPDGESQWKADLERTVQ